jgi:hypothetical protein
MIKPLFNNVLIEVMDEFAGLVGGGAGQSFQKGWLRDYALVADHLTMSVGYELENYDEYESELKNLLNRVVYWQEFADSGAKFEIDGKQYVLVPFYRLLGFDDETTKKGAK